jgi:hypothetical protein
MKMPPGRLGLVLSGLLLASLVGTIGCASKSTSRVQWVRPPTGDAETILRNQEVENRAHELLASGKYKHIENARVEAEKEIPRVSPPAQQEWLGEQARRQQQKKQTDEKFQSDFAKSRSGL